MRSSNGESHAGARSIRGSPPNGLTTWFIRMGCVDCFGEWTPQASAWAGWDVPPMQQKILLHPFQEEKFCVRRA